MLQKINETRTFLEECWDELTKVTWPDYDQLKNATLVIIAFVFAVSGIIWIMDVAVRNVIDFILGIFGV